MIGTRLSHFRILSRLGEGGMGVVYRAEDERLRRQVALKLLPPDLVASAERRLRFLREARAAAAVTHPSIAAIYEVDEAEGVVFIAMELVEGRTLRERIGGRPMAVRDALRIAVEIAEGLAHAHQARVVHRDLKPDNVMVRPDEHVKILDFGLAKLVQKPPEEGGREMSRLETVTGEVTRAGKVMGTPAYMSPEQALGQAVDARSDLFAFGSTLYEMATGRPPFRGRTAAEIMGAIVAGRVPPASRVNPEVPPALEGIISRCMRKETAERYQDARDLLVDLRRARRMGEDGPLAAETSGAPAALAPSGGWARVLKTATLRGVGFAALGALIIAAGAGLWRGLRPPGAFQGGEQVLVTDFESLTDEPELDAAARDAFEYMVADSRYLQVLRGERVNELMARQGDSRASRLTPAAAGKICRQGDCSGFFTGSVAREGAGYRLEVGLYRERGKEPAASASAVAPSEGDVLMAIHRMSLELRRSVGEAPQAVSATSPPTIRSLRAYQALAVAGRAHDSHEAITLLRRALEIDPDFVEAYSALAGAYFNTGQRKEYRRFVQEAHQRSSSLPERDRVLNEIAFLDAAYDFDGEIDLLKRAQRLYTFDDGPPDSLCALYLTDLHDPVSAEPACREALRRRFHDLGLIKLSLSLALQGKEDELERLLESYRSRGGAEASVADGQMWAELIRGDSERFARAVSLLESQHDASELPGTFARFVSLLGSGRLAEARSLGPAAWRAARATLWHYEIGLHQAWLDVRRSGGRVALSADQAEPARSGLTAVPVLAAFSVEAGLKEPLAGIIRAHEAAERGSRSRYVREELAFARGCLALVRGEAAEARKLLEPIARNSILVRRHRVLGRAYEALRLWSEAAGAYEDALRSPYLRWGIWFENPAVFVLDQYRLARVYERLGDLERARHWYERFLADWKNADPGIPEFIEAKKRLAALGTSFPIDAGRIEMPPKRGG